LVQTRFSPGQVEIVVHPQCYLSRGHFAGSDDERHAAMLDMANDPDIDVIWLARGGYGAARVALKGLTDLSSTARDKTWMGYSDGGALLAGLYSMSFPHVYHGPMPSDLLREGGHTAVFRALSWLVDRDRSALEPSLQAGEQSAAFNLTVLSQLIGTPLQPDLTGHVLMLEEVGEYHYRIDRALAHVTSNEAIRNVAGLRLGRCSQIEPNDPLFGLSELEIAQEWCDRSGIPFLGIADIGHDVDNRVVPFGGCY